MNSSIWFNLCNITVIGIICIYFPISGMLEARRRKKQLKTNKTKEYYSQVIWSFLPLICILIPLLLGYISPIDLGIGLTRISNDSFPLLAKYIVISIFSLHILYNLYSILMLKFNKNIRNQTAKTIKKEIYDFLPITKEERKSWKYVAISAGITEEIVYRGYLFFIINYYFPFFPSIIILLISSIIFGIGHIYQGKELLKPTILGLLFGFYYLSIGSLVPIIIIHIIQDMIVAYIFDEENSSEIT